MTYSWSRYRKTGVVTARRLSENVEWTTEAGDRMTGAAGDWLVVDVTGGERTVVDATFRASHRHVEGDRWERCSVVEARQATATETVSSAEGEATARPGNWIVRDAPGNAWPVPDAHFRQAYVAHDE